MKQMWSKEEINNAPKVLGSLVDSKGNPRFIEGNMTTSNIAGVTFKLAKFSLSGTHIMFVIAGEVANGTSLDNNALWASVKLPSWIYNKIYDIGGGLIENKIFNIYNSTATVLSNAMYYKKEAGNKISFYRGGATTATTNKGYFRIQFDLLIDTE